MIKQEQPYTLPSIYVDFQNLIWNYYREHGRSFAWRDSNDPYHILISEVMLQQTQTDRVIPKYEQFLALFPTIQSLAMASLKEVLAAWQGLGYNRRGMYLHNLAKMVMEQHQGIVPDKPELLQQLPGIGYATARSICAFAFNQSTVFIETNIRTVYIHTFFYEQTLVDDKQLILLIAQTVDQTNPRHWYYALMDYGVMLKKLHYNPSRKSKHHVIQSKFEGSDRQIRGIIIRLLLERSHERQELIDRCGDDQERVVRILYKMVREKFVVEQDSLISIPTFT